MSERLAWPFPERFQAVGVVWELPASARRPHGESNERARKRFQSHYSWRVSNASRMLWPRSSLLKGFSRKGPPASALSEVILPG
jgi:hypothetical protein